jgi:3'-5' exoribonuclease
MPETLSFFIDGKTVRPESMPSAYRVLDIKRVAISDTLICCTATLYHRHLSPRVAWTCSSIDPRIQKLALVAIRWDRAPVCEDGALHIARLVPVDAPDERVNLFDTVPPPLIPDITLVDRARALVNRLPRRFKRLLNAIFHDPQRLLWFAAGPAALSGPYAQMNGNLRRSVELAEAALRIAAGHRQVFPALLILGSLLRDAGKAERYRLDPARDRFVETEYGQLVGHRMTVVEWLTAALSRYPIDLPKPHRIALMHILSGATGTPEGRGLCQTQSLEASIIAMADRWLEYDAVYGRGVLHYAGWEPRARQDVLTLLQSPTTCSGGFRHE